MKPKDSAESCQTICMVVFHTGLGMRLAAHGVLKDLKLQALMTRTEKVKLFERHTGKWYSKSMATSSITSSYEYNPTLYSAI